MTGEINSAENIKPKGRPKGAKDRKPRRLRPSRYLPKDPHGEMPLDYMLRIMRDINQKADRRDQMAFKAAPYCHATYASIKMNHEGPNLAQLFAGMTADELAAFERFAAAVARLQSPRPALGYLGGEGSASG